MVPGPGAPSTRHTSSQLGGRNCPAPCRPGLLARSMDRSAFSIRPMPTVQAPASDHSNEASAPCAIGAESPWSFPVLFSVRPGCTDHMPLAAVRQAPLVAMALRSCKLGSPDLTENKTKSARSRNELRRICLSLHRLAAHSCMSLACCGAILHPVRPGNRSSFPWPVASRLPRNPTPSTQHHPEPHRCSSAQLDWSLPGRASMKPVPPCRYVFIPSLAQ